MTKKTTTVVAVNRLSAALAKHGVRLKRMQLLESVASAFGYRNSQEMAAADAEGSFAPAAARFLGRRKVPQVGSMLFLQDPDGTVFAVDEDRFDAQSGQAADWILSPLGGALDVSSLRATAGAKEPMETDDTEEERSVEPAPTIDADNCGAVCDEAVRHLAIRSQLNRAIYRTIREYRMGNMCDEGDPSSAYPLVDLMSNPAPSTIATGEMEMISLADEITDAVRRTLGLPDETTDAHIGGTPDGVKATVTSNPNEILRTKRKRQREDRPGAIDPLEPIYLTSGCCESTDHVDHEDLAALGLASGWFDGTFYPLTDAEAGYIAEDYVQAADGLHGALLGYSVLYRSAKWFMPTIEVAFQTDGDLEGEYQPREKVLVETMAYADRIRGKVEAFGGEVMTEVELDRVLVKILVPVAKAMDVGDFDAWKEMLAWLMVDPALPTVLREEVRHTGKRLRVSASWIGEGQEGDYDPETPRDHPLLRLDTDELVNGEWVEVRDGSYCCQVHAYAEPAVVRALVRMAVETLENGSWTKRDCEELSWVDEAKVRRWMEDEARANAVGDGDTFVAHVTYGNPDEGTSIDLRRRADGSVRCEVYVDLDCAAVLDSREGMPAVREWLKTLTSDVENADGPNRPAAALAPQWVPDGDEPVLGTTPMKVVWRLVPADEDEAAWFAEVPPSAPFERRFATIDEMDV